MRTIGRIFLLSAALALSLGTAKSQDSHMGGMGHGSKVLLVAQLSGAKVVPPGASTATGTGAFVIGKTDRALSYDLTYQGLTRGAPTSIVLRNFAAGANGQLVRSLCGTADAPCPSASSATMGGRFDPRQLELDGKLLTEFATGRIYVEIVGGDGKAEIRGQLEPNGAMARVANYTSQLQPLPGTQSKGSGTAVLSEVFLPGNRVYVFYDVTVADARGVPRNAALVGVPAGDGPNIRLFSTKNALPALKLSGIRQNATGGTMTGEYEVARSKDDALSVTQLMSAGNREVGIAISTSQFPNGELYGAFTPVQ